MMAGESSGNANQNTLVGEGERLLGVLVRTDLRRRSISHRQHDAGGVAWEAWARRLCDRLTSSST